MAILLTNKIIEQLSKQYRLAARRLFCLDYDGTLVDFAPTPSQAVPTPQVIALLGRLANDPANTVVIVSGRDKHALQTWFGHVPVGLSAEHGQFTKTPGTAWHATTPVSMSFKSVARPVMEIVQASLPGSFIEEKDTALCLHFRRSPAALAKKVVGPLQQSLINRGFSVIAGDKVLEVRSSFTTKAMAFQQWTPDAYDFALIAGDDTTDESMFTAARPPAITIKVRPGPTAATYTLLSPRDLLIFMTGLLEQSNQ